MSPPCHWARQRGKSPIRPGLISRSPLADGYLGSYYSPMAIVRRTAFATIAVLCAPAIVRAESLMRVREIAVLPTLSIAPRLDRHPSFRLMRPIAVALRVRHRAAALSYRSRAFAQAICQAWIEPAD